VDVRYRPRAVGKKAGFSLVRKIPLASWTRGTWLTPSGDGLNQPPRVSSQREPSGKKTGGQRGYPGTTLRQGRPLPSGMNSQ
jgi:hypothetical protein